LYLYLTEYFFASHWRQGWSKQANLGSRFDQDKVGPKN